MHAAPPQAVIVRQVFNRLWGSHCGTAQTVSLWVGSQSGQKSRDLPSCDLSWLMFSRNSLPLLNSDTMFGSQHA